jgi:hypothetical protein
MDNIIEYIHIPKNAGTFVKKFAVMSNNNININSCDNERELNGDCSHLHKSYLYLSNKNNNKCYMTIIRNPYDRFYSIYQYDKDFLINIFPIEIFDTFDTFLNYFYENKEMIYKHTHLYPQYEYLLNNNNEISDNIDILLFEDLPLNLKKYLDKKRTGYYSHKLYNIINKGKYKEKHLWTKEQKNKFNSIYEKDIEFYKKFNKFSVY